MRGRPETGEYPTLEAAGSYGRASPAAVAVSVVPAQAARARGRSGPNVGRARGGSERSWGEPLALGPASSPVLADYIVVQMFANACTDVTTAKDAARRAERYYRT